MRLALYTFGVFIKPAEHPDNDDFHTLNDQILPVVDQAAGLIARSGYEDEPGPPCWGEQVFPKFYEEKGDGWSPSTLSLWQDIEAAMAFSYFGLHAKAVKRGREWNVKPAWPPYAVWWVTAGHRPDWTEAVAQHLLLHERGPSPAVFTFKSSFDANGHAYTLDQTRMKAYVKQNEAA